MLLALPRFDRPILFGMTMRMSALAKILKLPSDPLDERLEEFRQVQRRLLATLRSHGMTESEARQARDYLITRDEPEDDTPAR